MRKAEVYMHQIPAGELIEDENGYTFFYNKEYLSNNELPPVSLTLPKNETPYRDKNLFPFFDGLIPEGWLLEIAQKNWKMNPRDRMGLLLTCCQDCIGAVKIIDKSIKNE
ncbi:MAG: phosphatidylinositol kinase [Bacteroidetes bacterium GWF2_38_335]|nr:MAG: phosphatidylinositol kinase [Bacteroidetes bacterium GWF2_38_335]OFY81195.1 MAG: phosphatidylinositol kinase [Bacteroidetes bacterium RIFOXYA12_FULL_38_20]HBS85311.1 phosphatidylinositol kinase [Bacteroidales bacterium]